MPLLDRPHSWPPARTRRLAGAAALLVLLGGAVTACGDDDVVEKTTCGDFLDKSDSQRLALVKEGVREQANPEEKEAIAKASDRFYPEATRRIVAACDGKDEDTQIKSLIADIDY